MLAPFIAAVSEPVAGRAKPFDRQWLRIVVVVGFEIGHAAAALTPDRNDDAARLDRTPDDAVGLVLFCMAKAIATLRVPVFFGIPEVLGIGALVFPAAIAAPNLSTV
jgi:hypothetical protein